eukprot:m.478785 g.478785  ORF g.478785 m.478785 type:complete len:66 (+) comp21229_c0_seq1:61-258(+)
MSALQTLYGAVFKRTSTFAIAVLGGALVFERVFDEYSDAWFYSRNKGKHFEDIPAVREQLEAKSS